MVLEFGGAESTDGLAAAWDETRNVDAQGNAVSTIEPGDHRYFCLQHDDTVEITRVAATLGEVIREDDGLLEASDLLGFADADDQQQLTWWPDGAPSARWYGTNGSGQELDGRLLSYTSGFPCLAKFDYQAWVRRYRLELPVSIAFDDDDTVPFRVYIYYQEQ